MNISSLAAALRAISRRAAFALGFLGVLMVAAELLVRSLAGPELQFRLNERRLHCLDSAGEYLVLCPGQSLDFAHAAGFRYRISTDERGERRVAPAASIDASPGLSETVDANDSRPDGPAPEIWLLGDSIAMGFGNDDGQTAADRLAYSLPGFRIRNLGVDSLGACGIHSRYRAALHAGQTTAEAGAATGARSPPRHTIWIFNPSDYTDDPRDQARLGQPLRRAAYRVRVWITRRLALPDFFRLLLKRGAAAPGNEAAPIAPATQAPRDPAHPTYACARAIFKLAGRQFADRGDRFTLLVYPDVDRRSGGPLAAPDPLKAPMVALAREFTVVQVLDLQEAFERHASDPDLYLPVDGHPGPGAQRLFHLGIRSILD